MFMYISKTITVSICILSLISVTFATPKDLHIYLHGAGKNGNNGPDIAPGVMDWRDSGMDGVASVPINGPMDDPMGRLFDRTMGKPLGNSMGGQMGLPMGGQMRSPTGGQIPIPMDGQMSKPTSGDIGIPFGGQMGKPMGAQLKGRQNDDFGMPQNKHHLPYRHNHGDVQRGMRATFKKPSQGDGGFGMEGNYERPMGYTENGNGETFERPDGNTRNGFGGNIERPLGFTGNIERPRGFTRNGLGGDIEKPGGYTGNGLGGDIENPGGYTRNGLGGDFQKPGGYTGYGLGGINERPGGYTGNGFGGNIPRPGEYKGNIERPSQGNVRYGMEASFERARQGDGENGIGGKRWDMGGGSRYEPGQDYGLSEEYSEQNGDLAPLQGKEVPGQGNRSYLGLI